MSGVFFYTIGIGFSVGILFCTVFSIGWPMVILVALVGLVLPFLVRLRIGMYPQWIMVLSLGLIALASGMARCTYDDLKESPLALYESASVSLSGVVVREPDVRERMTHLYVDPENTYGELVLVTVDRFVQVTYGDRIVAEGVLQKPEAFESDLGRIFDYAGYLKSRDVRHVIPFAEVSVTESGNGNSVVAALLGIKGVAMDALEQVLPEPHAGLGEGLLLGVKRALGPELEAVFRTTGIIHIIVLSGFNLMIVSEFVMRMLSYLVSHRWRILIGISIIVLFAIMVGLSATVVRASIMAILVLLARWTGHVYLILRALVLAGVGMLVVNPYLLVHDPGFQLSFLATLGLIFLAPRIEQKLQGVPQKFEIRSFLVATLATQLMVLPLLLYQTGQFSLVAIFVNVLVLPLVPLAMLCTFVAGVVGFVAPFLGALAGLPAYLSLGYIIAVPEFFAKLPFAAFNVPVFPFWIVVLMYGLLTYGFWRWSNNGQEIRDEKRLDDTLDEWVIEEEIEKVPEAQSASGTRPNLPFR